MAKIKRKISKRKTKTRKNCAPCLGALNPSRKGIRRRNPDERLGIEEHVTELSVNIYNRIFLSPQIKYLDINDLKNLERLLIQVKNLLKLMKHI